MKKGLYLLAILSFLLSNAQCKDVEPDSLESVSRLRADKVLQQLDLPSTSKMLFSLENKNFYVAIEKDLGYEEYYIATDSLGKVTEKHILDTNKKDRKLLSKAFKLDSYSKDFKTDIPNATYIRGKTSYFVLKDKNGNRYGEYRLPVFSLPPPIDGEVYGYLVRRISEETTKNMKAP